MNNRLLKDLRRLDATAYTQAEHIVLKYAISLLEIQANTQETRWTLDEFSQLPAILEMDCGHIVVKRWKLAEPASISPPASSPSEKSS